MGYDVHVSLYLLWIAEACALYFQEGESMGMALGMEAEAHVFEKGDIEGDHPLPHRSICRPPMHGSARLAGLET